MWAVTKKGGLINLNLVATIEMVLRGEFPQKTYAIHASHYHGAWGADLFEGSFRQCKKELEKLKLLIIRTGIENEEEI